MIALFDSGLGGLSVLREVRVLLPQHDLVYVADTAYCPYGPKPVAFVRDRALAIGRWLREQGADLLVVPCNTACSAALETLRATLPIPVVGIEPGLRPAAAATKCGVVGVLATTNTLKGQRFATLVQRFAEGVTVLTQPCPGLVEQVEAGDLGSPVTRGLVAQYVAPLLAGGADVLVLGCTHYPFLRELIAEFAGPNIELIDTGPAVAQQVVRVATQHHIAASTGRTWFLTTHEPAKVEAVFHRIAPELFSNAMVSWQLAKVNEGVV